MLRLTRAYGDIDSVCRVWILFVDIYFEYIAMIKDTSFSVLLSIMRNKK